MPLWLLAILALLLGLVLGSLFATAARVLPTRPRQLFAASRCDACSAPARAEASLPLVGFLLTAGRCPDCGAPSPWIYPLAELGTGVFFAVVVLRFGSTAATAVSLFFGAALILLALIDSQHFVLPDLITLPGIAVGLGTQGLVPWVDWRSAVVGALVGAGALLAVNELGQVLRGSPGLGLGDVKMLAMIGSFLGSAGVIVTLLLASTTVTALVGLQALGGRQTQSTRLPFGIFLSAAGLIALFFVPLLGRS